MSRRFEGRMDRLARRIPPPPPAARPGVPTPAELDALPDAEVWKLYRAANLRWRASPAGRALAAELDAATDAELVEMWLQLPRSWPGHGGKGRPR